MTRISKLLIAAVAALLTITLASPVAAAPAPDTGPAARTTYQPSWHKVHFHMNAYSGAGPLARCEGGAWDSDFGHCFGYGEHGTSAQSFPFVDDVSWVWWRQRHGLCKEPFPGHRDHDVWTHALSVSSGGSGNLCGWVDRHWGTYTLTGGRIWADGAYRPIHATTAVVGDREHTQGGPLFVFLGHRTGGYVLGLRGWLYY
jgi:hypothetical protein